MKKKILLSVLLLVLFTSCGNPSPETPMVDNNVDEVENSIDSAYPTSIDYDESYPSYNDNEESQHNDISPTPEASDQGSSTIRGQIFLNNSNLALKNTLLYLTPGKGENQSPPMILIGPEPENGDYATLSDDNAYFSFTNVNPGTYYLVVSSTNSYAFVEVENEPLQIVVSGDQILDLGKQFVILP